MAFDLSDLELFLHVAEAGSITAGARKAYLALPSASARIRGMEEVLGVALFSRERRGVRPTEAGRALLDHARAITRQWEAMRGELAEYARGLKGRIRFLCTTATLTEFLPDTLSVYLAKHPNINIDITERLSAEIVLDVAEGKADLGVVAAKTDVGALQTFPFGSMKLVLVAAPGHPLADRRQVRFGEMLDYAFVGLAEGSSIQRYLDGHAQRAGKRLNYRVLLRGFAAVCQMVEKNVGIALIPETAALRHSQAMDIRRIDLAEPWATREFTICVSRYDDLPGYAREFIDMIRA
jgi:molybdate transport repressor ModE-like protein